ncbi:hypothetical protein EJ04DRAFT_599421 [Polyplosphaeria fusca]|uniref:Uncharacterized protein n=1 Tax=Polyplosphaeria fusca TaxID=682080 RepID=A0A9P4QFU7_9PLEO|nr:hypothetical protein EJ04DRAFT_599421 [Polyplosphaeria fusca]
MKRYKTPREKLVALRARFSRGTFDCQTHLEIKYRDLQKHPKHGNLDSWFNNWITTCNTGIEAEVPCFLNDLPLWDFIKAVDNLYPAWGALKTTEYVQKKDANQKGYTTIDALVSEFSQLYHLKKPVQSNIGTFSATLEVAEPEKKNGKNKSKDNRSKS